MKRFTKALSIVLISAVPSISMGEIYRCSTGVTDQEMERSYANVDSAPYISGDAVIGLEGNKLSFVSFETATVIGGAAYSLSGKRDLECDTEYALDIVTLECWDNQKNNPDYKERDWDYAYEIVKISSINFNDITIEDNISAIKRGKKIHFKYSWFIFDKDERGLPDYSGINEGFLLSCR